MIKNKVGKIQFGIVTRIMKKKCEVKFISELTNLNDEIKVPNKKFCQLSNPLIMKAREGKKYSM